MDESYHIFNLNEARECDQLVDLTKQTVTECKTELEKLRNSDQKENQPNDKEIFKNIGKPYSSDTET